MRQCLHFLVKRTSSMLVLMDRGGLWILSIMRQRIWYCLNNSAALNEPIRLRLNYQYNIKCACNIMNINRLYSPYSEAIRRMFTTKQKLKNASKFMIDLNALAKITRQFPIVEGSILESCHRILARGPTFVNRPLVPIVTTTFTGNFLYCFIIGDASETQVHAEPAGKYCFWKQ